MATEYYLYLNESQAGPYTLQQLRTMWHSATINADTFYWREGLTDWMPLRTIMELLDDPASKQVAPIAQIGAMLNLDANKPPRSRTVFILLGFFLGLLGIHNFYAGYTTLGLIQLALTLFLFWTVLVPILTIIWVLFELISVTKDGRGVPFAT